jgi:hypothetical protein
MKLVYYIPHSLSSFSRFSCFSRFSLVLVSCFSHFSRFSCISCISRVSRVSRVSSVSRFSRVSLFSRVSRVSCFFRFIFWNYFLTIFFFAEYNLSKLEHEIAAKKLKEYHKKPKIDRYWKGTKYSTKYVGFLNSLETDMEDKVLFYSVLPSPI